MTENITALCQECDAQFNYVLKPGFPRKYCPKCSALKKAEWEAAQGGQVNTPVVRPQGKAETFKTKNGHAAMYVSYAKDLMVIGFNAEDAIEAIEKLKEAFE